MTMTAGGELLTQRLLPGVPGAETGRKEQRQERGWLEEPQSHEEAVGDALELG